MENRKLAIGHVFGAIGLILLGMNAFVSISNASLYPPPSGVSLLVCVIAGIHIKNKECKEVLSV